MLIQTRNRKKREADLSLQASQDADPFHILVVPGKLVSPPDRTNRLRYPDRLPCDGGRRAPNYPRDLRPAGLIRVPASKWPLASHHKPARASVSTAGASAAVSACRKSSTVILSEFRVGKLEVATSRR
jgi:hypothetical protein